MMIGKRLVVYLIVLICFSAPLMAGLDDFREDVIEAEKEAKTEKEYTDTRTEEQKQLDTELFAAILRLWLIVNVAVDYGPYPYAPGAYIRYRDGDEPAAWKFNRFSLGTDLFYAPRIGGGYHAAFEGKIFPLMGPYFELTGLYDGKDQLYLVSLGGNLSLFQTQLLCADFYLQWTTMQALLTRSGTAFGFLLTSYPLRPVSVAAKIGARTYRGGLELDDWSVSVGWHIQRLELFSGWRSLQTEAFSLAGLFCGVRIHY